VEDIVIMNSINQKIILMIMIVFFQFTICNSNELSHNNLHLKYYKKPYIRSIVGNLTGFTLGAIVGSITGGALYTKGKYGVGNVIILGYSAYTGAVIGSAAGSTIALGKGLSIKEKSIIFSFSLAPHLVNYGILLNDKNAPAHSKSFKVSFGISFPLSIRLPAFYYKKFIKTKRK